jgi:phosphatidate cytidylyltransferase
MQILNPLVDPLFPTLAWSLLALLVGGLLYGLILERKNLGQFFRSSIFQRLLGVSIMAPLAVACILSGSAVITGMVVILSVVCVFEFTKVTSLPVSFGMPAFACSIILPIAAAMAPDAVLPTVVVAMLATGTLSVLTFGKQAGTGDDTLIIKRTALAFLAVAYVPLLASFVVLVSQLAGGGGVLALITMVAGADTAAYIFGRMLGRRKLAPHVSPNKTIAGGVGAVIGAYAGFLVMQFACPPLPIWVLAVLPLLAAVAAVLGDLFESVIKRSYQVKDAGNWIPGVGGLLDRVDSLLFVFPVAYFIFVLAL